MKSTAEIAGALLLSALLAPTRWEESMNDKQKRIIMLAIGVVVAMLAFPPFYIRIQAGVVVSLGYGFLFDPPRYGTQTNWLGTVDVGLLLIQWLAVILIAGALWWLAKDKTE